MRLVLIVLVLAACAPMPATQFPEAATINPAAPPLGNMAATTIPQGTNPSGAAATQQPAYAGTRAASVPAFELTPAQTAPHAGLATLQLLQQVSAGRLHADLLKLQGFHTRHSASAAAA